ncbi:hypothetical protein M8C21_018466 [Ambrosia artemisiifolia]|uniref:Uncharacterized protein n=1 Tax=Ambrosia artemisiifolia TaxID=4212 RepID=A0AAD5BP00_AMBAR|nr:hypothetical protein M8C21_018466 [Ambrosia artemisiifolia]
MRIGAASISDDYGSVLTTTLEISRPLQLTSFDHDQQAKPLCCTMFYTTSPQERINWGRVGQNGSYEVPWA